MRKTALLLAALSLAGAPTALTANPSSPPNSGADGVNGELLAFCYSLFDVYPSLNLGECMSFNSVSDPGFKTHLCDLLRETDGYADWGVTSYSDCVRNVGF